MTQTAVGIAAMWLVVMVRGGKFKIEGGIAYGLGTLILLPFAQK